MAAYQGDPLGSPRNPLEYAEELKRWSKEELMQEMSSPSDKAPGYMVFAEMTQRDKQAVDWKKRETVPDTSMVEERIAADSGGIGSLAPPPGGGQVVPTGMPGPSPGMSPAASSGGGTPYAGGPQTQLPGYASGGQVGTPMSGLLERLEKREDNPKKGFAMGGPVYIDYDDVEGTNGMRDGGMIDSQYGQASSQSLSNSLSGYGHNTNSVNNMHASYGVPALQPLENHGFNQGGAVYQRGYANGGQAWARNSRGEARTKEDDQILHPWPMIERPHLLTGDYGIEGSKFTGNSPAALAHRAAMRQSGPPASGESTVDFDSLNVDNAGPPPTGEGMASFGPNRLDGALPPPTGEFNANYDFSSLRGVGPPPTGEGAVDWEKFSSPDKASGRAPGSWIGARIFQDRVAPPPTGEFAVDWEEYSSGKKAETPSTETPASVTPQRTASPPTVSQATTTTVPPGELPATGGIAEDPYSSLIHELTDQKQKRNLGAVLMALSSGMAAPMGINAKTGLPIYHQNAIGAFSQGVSSAIPVYQDMLDREEDERSLRLQAALTGSQDFGRRQDRALTREGVVSEGKLDRESRERVAFGKLVGATSKKGSPATEDILFEMFKRERDSLLENNINPLSVATDEDGAAMKNPDGTDMTHEDRILAQVNLARGRLDGQTGTSTQAAAVPMVKKGSRSRGGNLTK